MSQVYRAYLPLARTVCAHGFGGFKGFFDPVDRDDALQAIFLAAFEERARLGYDGLRPYGSYLRGIAHNVVRQMLDKRTRFQRQPDPDQLGPRGPVDQEAAYIERETCDVLRAFREGLTDPVERQVLQLYFCDGWAEERLAEHLELTRYRLRKIIARLHKRTRKYLEAHGF